MTVDRSRVVVLVPFLTHIEHTCELGLRELERMGYTVRRQPSSAAIDRTRCDMATAALADNFEHLMWIDSDVEFAPAAVDQLLQHDLPVVAGLYPKKGARAFAVYFEEGTRDVQMGEGGYLLDVRYVGAGFVMTNRMVYDDIRRTFDLPVCNARWGMPTIPFFLPMVVPDGTGGYWYLGEDFAFCERARQAGHKITVDTTIRLGHVGKYAYQWEDAGTSVPRATSARFEMGSSPESGDVSAKR